MSKPKPSINYFAYISACILRILRAQFEACRMIFIVLDGWNDVNDAIRNGLDDLLSDLLVNQDEVPAKNVSVMVIARFSEKESALYTVTCSISQAKEWKAYRHCYDCERNGNPYDLCEPSMAERERWGHPSHKLEEVQRIEIAQEASKKRLYVRMGTY